MENKMSANTNKQKGKRKCLPKLKTILANPNKDKCPSLDEEALHKFSNLLKDVINRSGLKPQSFVTSRHIHLGLESSLRAINKSKCSCVLLSRSVQPKVLIRLIARNVEAKNASVPVFVQNQLEDFTKVVFGIKALSVAFPAIDEMRENNMDETLIKWIMTHTKEIKPKTKVIKKTKITKIKQVPVIEVRKESPVVQLQKLEIENTSKGNEEFISFTDGKEVDRADSAEDEKHLVEVLNKVAERVHKQAITEAEDIEMKSYDDTQQDDLKRSETFSDSDDFLPTVYQPLTVHKIQPNPNRKPKKKKQKKNRENKN